MPPGEVTSTISGAASVGAASSRRPRAAHAPSRWPQEGYVDQPEYAALIEAALGARSLAYTPYSHFQVGAAVLTATARG